MLKTVRLSKSHQRSTFDCGFEYSNDWLKTKARRWQKMKATAVHVAVDDTAPDQIMGFYSLSSKTVQLSEIPEKHAPSLGKNFSLPSVLLGQLAVDRKWQRQGLGRFLLFDAMKKCVQISEAVGVCLIEVDAASESAREFYIKNGFFELLDDKQHLFLPLEQVAAELKNQRRAH